MLRARHLIPAALAACLLLAAAAPAEDIVIGSIPDGPAFNVFAPPQESSVEVCHAFLRSAFGPSGRFDLHGEIALTAIGPRGTTGEVSFRLRAGGAAAAGAHISDVPVREVLLEVKIVEATRDSLATFPLSTVIPFVTGGPVVLPDGIDDVQACVRSNVAGVGMPVWRDTGSVLLGRDGDVGSFREFLENLAGIKLIVTPRVTSGTEVELLVVPQVATLTTLPDVEWRTAATAVAVEEGATLTIEGIERDSNREIPVLGDVPLLGGLFKKVDTFEGAGSLLIFVTADIVTNQAHTAAIDLVGNVGVQTIITATLPDGRQFGQLLNARPVADAQPAGTKAILFTSHDPTRYRVNVGVTAAEDGTVVRLTPLGADGTAVATAHSLSLPIVGANTQINDVFSFFGLADIPNAVIEVEVVSGSAFSYSSAVDGRSRGVGTSDPTTQLPARDGAPRVTLLEVGRIQGINEFSGSAMVHNRSTTTAFVQAAFTPRGATAPAATVSFTLAPGRTVGWDDVVGELIARNGEVGTLVFTTTNGTRISAIAREFAVFRDAQNRVTGTAGQLMPGLTEDDLLQPGRTWHFLGLVDGGGERSHLAAYNPGPGSIVLGIGSFDAGGASRGSLQRTVRPGELLRLNSILPALDSAHDGGERRLEVTVSGPAHVLAYRVNATGDPVTLLPFSR